MEEILKEFDKLEIELKKANRKQWNVVIYLNAVLMLIQIVIILYIVLTK